MNTSTIFLEYYAENDVYVQGATYEALSSPI